MILWAFQKSHNIFQDAICKTLKTNTIALALKKSPYLI